ncbi:DUF1456 family protein [Flavobacterium caeni]|uniref:Uncharacterized protein n=1 Tax=Flavobacterium caeni TaxID=490189 RepID=A0A1G5K8M1_9FLAO|nr:DUF1456 family protein [Flavobacterium caeni]SCY96986.1 Protein of unknown function [Flavobacterium caeni]
MNNNDIFKKLRVALQLRDDQIVDILELVDFRISKGEIGNFFRNPDHPKFVECGDQVLRNFLNGLVIHLRGTKESPKNAMDSIAQNKAQVKSAEKQRFPKSIGTKTGASGTKPKPAAHKPTAKKPTTKKPEIVENVKFKNGKNKKS